MEKELSVMSKSVHTIQTEANPVNDNLDQFRREVNTDRLIEEFLTYGKEECINVKRAITASNTEAKSVLTQNERIIDICEKELQKDNITDSARDKLYEMMNRAMDSSKHESAASREFKEKQLANMHKQKCSMLVIAVGLMFVVVLCAAVRTRRVNIV